MEQQVVFQVNERNGSTTPLRQTDRCSNFYSIKSTTVQTTIVQSPPSSKVPLESANFSLQRFRLPAKSPWKMSNFPFDDLAESEKHFQVELQLSPIHFSYLSVNFLRTRLALKYR